ncbi:174_t:CDS:1, partial [Ambispora gerdemannii]
ILTDTQQPDENSISSTKHLPESATNDINSSKGDVRFYVRTEGLVGRLGEITDM